MGRKPIKLNRKRFGQLEVIKRMPSNGKYVRWKCKCDCGNYVVVKAEDLRSGKVTSCGCTRYKTLNDMPDREMKIMSASANKVINRGAYVGEPYQNLANAIVAIAVDDYRRAVKTNNKGLMYALERFFYSEWYTLLTGVDPDFIIDEIKHEVFKEKSSVMI